jgi:hypothetical protein
LALDVAIAFHNSLGFNLSIPGKMGNGIINDINHILSSHRKLHIPVVFVASMPNAQLP